MINMTSSASDQLIFFKNKVIYLIGTFYFLQSLHSTLFLFISISLYFQIHCSQILWLIHDFRSIPVHKRGLFSLKHLIVSSAMKLTSQASCNNLKSFYKIISKLFKNLKQIFKPFRKPIDIFACSHYKLLHLTNWVTCFLPSLSQLLFFYNLNHALFLIHHTEKPHIVLLITS